jgi:hypothetical protein
MHKSVRTLAAIAAVAAAAACSWTDSEGDSTLDEIRALPGPAPYFVGEEFEELPLTVILGRGAASQLHLRRLRAAAGRRRLPGASRDTGLPD